jgi:hypothetical protein
MGNLKTDNSITKASKTHLVIRYKNILIYKSREPDV